MINAVLFDMDGLLVDSEPLWQEAEIWAFAQIGINVTAEMCRQVMGLKLSELIDLWLSQNPHNTTRPEDMYPLIDSKLIELITTRAEAMQGVGHALNYFSERGFKIALASSSSFHLIYLIINKLGIADRFQIVHSSEIEPYGKPHPTIFLTTAEKLGVRPTECLVLEDSLNGVIAAKAARMKCIAIPEKNDWYNPKFAIADIKLHSLDEICDDIILKL